MRKNILAPSILSADFMNLGEDIEEAVKNGAEYIHFDVMDGMFVPNISFGLPVLASTRKGTRATLDVHLMITEPERYVEEFAKQGADIVTFHYEATKDMARTIALIKGAGAKVGVSVKPKTPVDVLFPYIKDLDMILVMSVEPGFGGQSFMEESLDRIAAIRAEAEKQGKELDIEVDGGIGAGNAGRVTAAGANVLVAGSAVFRGNIGNNVKALLNAMNGGEA